ncbi:uncharacterized protein V6R79_014793 [Siganus canaliculatus]
MDPTDSGQGPDKPPEPSCDLTPTCKGRQRKRNSRYSDFETDDKFAAENAEQKSPKKSPRARRGAAAKRSPAKTGSVSNGPDPGPDGDVEGDHQDPQESEYSEDTPQKPGRGRKTPAKRRPGRKTPAKKTPAKKTPAKKTPAGDGGVPAEEGGAEDSVQTPNGTTKRKYVRKRPVQEVVPDPEPAGPEEAPNEPEEEVQPGGRQRRGAAKAALKYLHILAKEVLNHEEAGSRPTDDDTSRSEAARERKSAKEAKGRRGRKRKRGVCDSDPEDDEDFVPNAEDEEVEEELEDKSEGGDDSDPDLDFGPRAKSQTTFRVYRPPGPIYRTENGLSSNMMGPVWEAAEANRKYREEHCSSWAFPSWIPSTNSWILVPARDVETYLPQERRSVSFAVSREGLRSPGETPLQTLSRFSSVPAHQDCWDMQLFTGGPVWAMEWCPTPDGSPAAQYVALASHRDMDERHHVHRTYGGPGLVQLWDLGQLECSSRPESQPALAYGLALDRGFIWQLKWCPAGGWESPSSSPKAPDLPRLGLLAVATSSGEVLIYSLPHPGALKSSKNQDSHASEQLPVYRVAAVLTLKLGSFRAPRLDKSGQVLCLDWLPGKPHNIMAVGFYDGVVGLWDLSTQSALLRVREPDKSLSLLPYRSFLAHDHAVRALTFCPASRNLLATAGEDRLVKTWDLRRLYEPVSCTKRYLTNEIHWPLNSPGVLLAQDNAYAAAGSHGVHYLDHCAHSYFAIPRTGTLWSISYSDWLNAVATADSCGEVIFALLPHLSFGLSYVKRSLERRFPVYLTSLVPYNTTEEEKDRRGVGVEDADVGQQDGGEAEDPDPGSEAGNGSSDGRDEARGRRSRFPPLKFQLYKDAVKKCYVQHRDGNMETFKGMEKRPVWKHMKATEVKAKLNLDDMQLAALHKVRFNPNLRCHTWLASGGQTGLVRLMCIKGMFTPQARELIRKSRNVQSGPRDPETDHR